MKTNYRGFKIEAYRDLSLSGPDFLYYTITKLEDGCIIEDNFSYSNANVQDFIKVLKRAVDNIIEHPEEHFDSDNEEVCYEL